MDNVKVSLTFILPGSVMMSSQECEENPNKNYNTHKVTLTEIKGKGKHKKEIKTVYTIKTKKSRAASQHINMSNDAYLYMLNTPTNAKFARIVRSDKKSGKGKRVWDIMSEHDRLKQHFDLLANDLKAISYKYEILED